VAKSGPGSRDENSEAALSGSAFDGRMRIRIQKMEKELRKKVPEIQKQSN
jgi:hypothetical protein